MRCVRSLLSNFDVPNVSKFFEMSMTKSKNIKSGVSYARKCPEFARDSFLCNMLRLGIVLAWLFVGGCMARPVSQPPAGATPATVIRVIDGDTFVVDDGSEKGATVRLIGVDAPETRRSANRDIGHYGEESKAFLTQLLSGGQVFLAHDVGKRDRYRRTLAYVYLPDGTFINAELVRRGYATVMTVPPNVAHAELFSDLEREARRKRRGLWK